MHEVGKICCVYTRVSTQRKCLLCKLWKALKYSANVLFNGSKYCCCTKNDNFTVFSMYMTYMQRKCLRIQINANICCHWIKHIVTQITQQWKLNGYKLESCVLPKIQISFIKIFNTDYIFPGIPTSSGMKITYLFNVLCNNHNLDLYLFVFEKCMLFVHVLSEVQYQRLMF